ncbi:MgtC/SapB family protein [Williamsia deligens]|uniref:MgtC/SapB family protein n=1 Tax=Williamsia deligens TaxID=321325 RepID=A0ABW3G4J7_9NOCA|nr:MgtC/SapB family protein [Williamsia deligens]MCP2194171.1 putative Mg2+ transporter-C (MgtC) family protein [Williamsia deligens]
MSTLDTLLRLLCGLGLGTLIGFERQYRARMAGLRTNALVATGATLFVVLSAHGFSGGTADPTRVAAQIVSGIGFLGAGVILRDGFGVRGLNTAATLWCSAAVGALAGAGLYDVAAMGTVAVVTVNVALRWLGRAVDRHPESGDETPSGYTVTVVTDSDAGPAVRAMLLDQISGADVRVRGIDVTDTDDATRIVLEAVCDHRDDDHIDAAVVRLGAQTAVRSVRWDRDTALQDSVR